MPINREQSKLITDIIDGTGITSTVDQSGTADEFTLSVDTAWLQAWVNANVAATPLTDSDAARLSAIEALVGITTSTSGFTSGGTANKFITVSDQVLTADLTFTWNIVTGDGIVIYSKTVKVGSGATREAIYKLLVRSIVGSVEGSKYISTATYSEANNRVDFAFNEAYPTATLTITNVTTTDSVTFSVTQ